MSRPTKPGQVLMQFKVPAELHKALRIYAIEQGQTMAEVGSEGIAELLRRHNRLPQNTSQQPQSDRLAQSA